jgi:ribosomal protein L29
MKAQEIREKSAAERDTILRDLRKKERELRFAIAGRETRNHRELRATKGDIARILTIAREAEVME